MSDGCMTTMVICWLKMDRPCHRYATIIEPVKGVDVADHPERSSAVCGRRSRRQHVYTSAGHVVHIRLESYRVNPDHFVLTYKGSPSIDQIPLGTSRRVSTRHDTFDVSSPCISELCRACRTARLDTLDTTSSTGSTRRTCRVMSCRDVT